VQRVTSVSRYLPLLCPSGPVVGDSLCKRDTDVSPTSRFGDRRYADNVGRFADTYNFIKTAFHDTDILADVGEDVGVVSALADILVGLVSQLASYYRVQLNVALID